MRVVAHLRAAAGSARQALCGRMESNLPIDAYWPVRIELRLLGGSERWLVASAAFAAIACHLVGRVRARRWSIAPEEPTADAAIVSVLDPGSVIRPIPAVTRSGL